MSERRRFAAFLIVLTAVVLEVADATIVNTALPAIRGALDATPAQMQWIVAGYLLALGSLLLLGGRLGDALGHSRVFLAGVGAFVTASALCGLAQDPTQLVIARLAQGAAGAMMAPQTMAIVQLLYTPLERVGRLAYFGLILGLAAIAGPIAGGVLIEMDLLGLGWRLIFLVNLPIGVVTILVGRLVLPEAEEHAKMRVDPAGALIFASAFGAVLYGLINGAEAGWDATLLALTTVGAGLLAVGWQRARRRRQEGAPSVLATDLFSTRTFRWGILAAFGFSSASIGFLLVFAVALQQGLGLTPLETALVHVPFGAGVMLAVGVIVPRLLPRMGKRLPLLGGMLMTGGVAAALLSISAGDGGSPGLLALLAVAGVGMGLLSGPLGPIVVAEVDNRLAGTASATFRTAQQIGGALGIALVGAAYFSVSGAGAPARLDGLSSAAVAVTVLLCLSMASVSRLPEQIFPDQRID